MAAEDLALLLPKGRAGEVEKELQLESRLKAPLQTESPVGSLVVKSSEGEELGRAALVPAENVKRARLFTFYKRYLEKWLRCGS